MKVSLTEMKAFLLESINASDQLIQITINYYVRPWRYMQAMRASLTYSRPDEVDSSNPAVVERLEVVWSVLEETSEKRIKLQMATDWISRVGAGHSVNPGSRRSCRVDHWEDIHQRLEGHHSHLESGPRGRTHQHCLEHPHRYLASGRILEAPYQVPVAQCNSSCHDRQDSELP